MKTLTKIELYFWYFFNGPLYSQSVFWHFFTEKILVRCTVVWNKRGCVDAHFFHQLQFNFDMLPTFQCPHNKHITQPQSQPHLPLQSQQPPQPVQVVDVLPLQQPRRASLRELMMGKLFRALCKLYPENEDQHMLVFLLFFPFLSFSWSLVLEYAKRHVR